LESNEKAYITFGSQMGDINAANAVQPHLIELRKLLEKYCNKLYCEEVDELAPILRVDGEGWYWEFEGCEKLRLSKKYRYITVDIGMPRSRWEGIQPADIRKYLFFSLKGALELMIKRLKKEKYLVNDTELWADISEIKEQFLLK
jgi:hypothetical protein